MISIFQEIHRITNRLIVHLYSLAARLRIRQVGSHTFFRPPCHIIGGQAIEIGSYTEFADGVRLATWNEGRLSIGNSCAIGHNSFITASNEIRIGNNVLFGGNVLVSDNSHGRCTPDELDIPPIKREVFSKGPVVIDDNAWIGQNACILANVHVGKGAIIGANSVVTHDVPPYCVAVGSPAKVIQKLK